MSFANPNDTPNIDNDQSGTLLLHIKYVKISMRLAGGHINTKCNVNVQSMSGVLQMKWHTKQISNENV